MIGIVHYNRDIIILVQYKFVDCGVIFHEESVWVGDDIVFHRYEENGLKKTLRRNSKKELQL